MTLAPTIPAELLEVVKAARALLADANSRKDLFDARCRDLRTALANLDRIS